MAIYRPSDIMTYWSVADLDGDAGGEIMASAERELIMGVWDFAPMQLGPGVKPLVRGSGGCAP